MNRCMKVAAMIAIMVLMVAVTSVAFAQTTGDPPPSGFAQIIIMATMVVQWVGSFAASRTWSLKARKLIPTVNLIISAAAQIVAAFATGLGPAPIDVTMAVAPGAIQAGIFTKIGNTFLDILVNSILQTFIVTGGHSATKNTVEAVKLGKKAK